MLPWDIRGLEVWPRGVSSVGCPEVSRIRARCWLVDACWCVWFSNVTLKFAICILHFALSLGIVHLRLRRSSLMMTHFRSQMGCSSFRRCSSISQHTSGGMKRTHCRRSSKKDSVPRTNRLPTKTAALRSQGLAEIMVRAYFDSLSMTWVNPFRTTRAFRTPEWGPTTHLDSTIFE